MFSPICYKFFFCCCSLYSSAFEPTRTRNLNRNLVHQFVTNRACCLICTEKHFPIYPMINNGIAALQTTMPKWKIRACWIQCAMNAQRTPLSVVWVKKSREPTTQPNAYKMTNTSTHQLKCNCFSPINIQNKRSQETEWKMLQKIMSTIGIACAKTVFIYSYRL